MILDKKDLPDDPTPSEAPPSYDDLTSNGVVQPGSGTGSGRFGGRFWRFGDEKRDLSDAGTSSTAGPSRLGGAAGRLYPFANASSSSTVSSSSATPQAAATPSSPFARPSKLTKSKSKASGGGISWLSSFTFSHRDVETQRDVRATVLGLIRNLVQNAPSSASSLDARDEGAAVAAEGIVKSCEAACDRCGLSLSEVLQERSVEGHTPLYWAVVKRPRPSRTRGSTHSRNVSAYSEDGYDSDTDVDLDAQAKASEADTLLHLILSHTAPLSASTLSEIRLACLVAADNTLLQRLRADPAVVPRSGAEAMLHGSLSASTPTLSQGDLQLLVDIVKVYEDNGEEGDKCGAFVVRMKIRRFQKRMRVAGGVGIEFVARGRLWFLTFFIVPPSSQLVPLPNNYHRPSSQSTSTATSASASSPPPHPLHPSHPAHAAVSHTLLTREKERRSSAPALGVGSWAVALGLMEYGSACWVDGRLNVEEWDLEGEEEREREREKEKEERWRREAREREEREERERGTRDKEKEKLGKLIDIPYDSNSNLPSTSSGSPYISPNNTGTSSSRSRPSSPPLPSLPPSTPTPTPTKHTQTQTQKQKPSPTPRPRPKKSKPKPKPKPKPTIVLNLKTPNNAQLTVPPAPLYTYTAEDGKKRDRETERVRAARERERQAQMQTQMQVCAMAGFEESVMGGSLQFDGSTYIAPDETLHATLEARLAKPESECVIC